MDVESLRKLEKPDLIAIIVALNARVVALEAKLNIPPKTPDNSSLPPSTGRKANRPDTPKPPRKGRLGVTRALEPNPDHVRDVYAEACNGCGTRLSRADQPGVHAYDYIDLPPIRPVTTRINLHRGSCPCCGERVAADPPADMPAGSPFGPGIVALVVYLHACQLVSYNRPRLSFRPPRSPPRLMVSVSPALNSIISIPISVSEPAAPLSTDHQFAGPPAAMVPALRKVATASA